MNSPNDHPDTFDGKSAALVTTQAALLIYLAITGPVLPTNQAQWLLTIAGLILAATAGWAMRQTTFRVSPRPAATARLVTTGPYRCIRHPMYAALMLLTLAWVASHQSPDRILAAIGLVIALLFKLNYEESLLKKHFKQYKDYARRTKRLIPFVY